MRKSIFLTSLIFTVLVVGGTGYSSVIYPQIAINQKLLDEAENKVVNLNRYDGRQLTELLQRIESMVGSSVKGLQSLYENPDSSVDFKSYYHNASISGGPPGLYWDTVRREAISYNATAYKIAPWAFNGTYEETYLNSAEKDDPLRHINADIKQTVEYGAKMGTLWQEILQIFPEINDISMGFANGVFTTYPWRTLEKTYDHTQSGWYPAAISGVKDIVIVVDRSGSMEGEKIETLRNTTKEIISDLGGKDRFNIISFADNVKAFKDRLVSLNDEVISQSDVFLDTMIPGGTTNILAAMTKALDILSSYGQPKHQKVVVFVTDGKATTGVTDTTSIVKEIAKSNGLANAELMMYGFGKDTDYPLLTQIANVTSGYSAWYNSSENITKFVPAYHDILAQKLPNLNPIWGSPHIEKTRLGQIITVSQPVYFENRLIGVMKIEVSLNFLKEAVSSKHDLPSEYEFITDSGGITVMHPETMKIAFENWTAENSRLDIETLEGGGNQLNTLMEKVKSGEMGSDTITRTDGDKYTYAINQLGNTGLLLGTVVKFTDLIPEEVIYKVDLIRISPTVLIPGIGIGLLSVIVVTIIVPYFIEEEKKK